MIFTPAEGEAIRLSLLVACVATLGALPVALALGHALARRDFPGKFLVDAATHLPLVLPPVVVGYLLLIAFGRTGPLGRFFEETFGLVFAFRWTGAALASAIMGFPLMLRAIRLSFENIDRRLEEASATLGAGPLQRFATVTLPLAWPGIVAGAVLCFARALGEFGATITFVSNIPGETRTIPSAIHAALETPGGEPLAWRLTLASIAISFVAVLLAERLARRKASRERR